MRAHAPLARRWAAAAVVAGLALAGCSSTPSSTSGDPTTTRAGGGSTSTGAGSASTSSTAATGSSSPTAATSSTGSVGGPTTTAGGSATSTTRPTSSTVPVTSVAPASSIPAGATPGLNPALTTQLFWVRPPEEDRPLDLPGFRDPPSGPRPLVLYGSVTNDSGAPVTQPFVVATWQSGGAPVGSARAAVYEPGTTTPAATLAPGAMADVIVVVTDPADATRLGPLTVTLAAGST